MFPTIPASSQQPAQASAPAQPLSGQVPGEPAAKISNLAQGLLAQRLAAFPRTETPVRATAAGPKELETIAQEAPVFVQHEQTTSHTTETVLGGAGDSVFVRHETSHTTATVLGGTAASGSLGSLKQRLSRFPQPAQPSHAAAAAPSGTPNPKGSGSMLAQRVSSFPRHEESSQVAAPSGTPNPKGSGSMLAQRVSSFPRHEESSQVAAPTNPTGHKVRGTMVAQRASVFAQPGQATVPSGATGPRTRGTMVAQRASVFAQPGQPSQAAAPSGTTGPRTRGSMVAQRASVFAQPAPSGAVDPNGPESIAERVSAHTRLTTQKRKAAEEDASSRAADSKGSTI